MQKVRTNRDVSDRYIAYVTKGELQQGSFLAVIPFEQLYKALRPACRGLPGQILTEKPRMTHQTVPKADSQSVR